MIHTYDKTYLDKARTALGRMLDFAVYDLKYDINASFQLFIHSGTASRFESGDFKILVRMSGVELAYEVLERSGLPHERIYPNYSSDRSEEYWTGWALAYYHEMDVRQFADKLNELYLSSRPETNLKRLRQSNGLSQHQLSELPGVPLRTIQQYEQRQKNINKAQAEYLIMLFRALCCETEDLIEKVRPL